MRRMLNILVVVVVILVLFALLVMRQGQLEKLPDLLIIGAGNCSQPCWNGIQPGITSYRAARGSADNADDFHNLHTNQDYFCESRTNYQVCIWEYNGVVSEIHLNPTDETVQMADLAAFFGEPLTARICTQIDTWISQISFAPGSVAIGAMQTHFDGQPIRHAPEFEVVEIIYFSSHSSAARRYLTQLPWTRWGLVDQTQPCW